MADLEKDVDTGGEGGEEQRVDETKYIPVERFNEVYGKFKEYERSLADYKKYGAPDEIRQRHEKLTQWEKAVDEAKRKANETPDEKSAAERSARIRKELVGLFPELANLNKIGELENRYSELSAGEAEATAREVLAEHSAAFTPLLKAAGIDPKHQSDIEEYLIAKMSADERVAFLQGDFNVAKAWFDYSLKEGMLAGLVKRTAPIPPMLRNPVGGTVVKGGKPKPISMKDALDIGWSRMNSGSED